MSEVLPIVILAGGLATRLRPLTETIPKALVEINGEPFIYHQLRLLHQKGIRQIIMSVGYLGEKIESLLGNGQQFDLHIQYVFDGPTLLGTAGAVINALPLLPDNFFVINGDSYLPCDFKAVQQAYFKNKKLGLMTVYKNEGKWDTSNVEFQTDSIITYEKINRNPRMQHIDYGLSVFNKIAFASIHNKPVDLTQVYQDLIRTKQLAAFEVFERFYENGSFTGVSDLEYYLNHNLEATE